MLHLYKLEDIAEPHLEALIKEGVREGALIDYKRAINLKESAAKAELLRDVSSFANSAGGHIVIGVEEERGLPICLDGISADFEKLEQQINQILRTHIDPPVTAFRMRAVPLAKGTFVFLLRIDKAWNGPHMVMMDGENRCWTRDHSGKRMMDIPDLKQALAFSEGAAERMKKFRTGRIADVLAGETPIPLKSNQCVILHLFPLVSFTGNFQTDPSKLNETELPPMRHGSGWSPTFTFEGKMTYTSLHEGPAYTYMLVFRNGIVEAVETSALNPEEIDGRLKGMKLFFPWHFKMIHDALAAALKAYDKLSVPLPVFGALSLTGVKGYHMYIPPEYSGWERQAINRDVMAFPEFLIENFTADPKEILQQTFDVWWQSCGFRSMPGWVTKRWG